MRRLAIALATLTLNLAACDAVPGAGQGESCTDKADCADALSCFEGHCQADPAATTAAPGGPQAARVPVPAPAPESEPKPVLELGHPLQPAPEIKIYDRVPTTNSALLGNDGREPQLGPMPTGYDRRSGPFGDPSAFGMMKRIGDPWAETFMAAIKEPAKNYFGAPPFDGDFKFRMQLCKNGSVSEILSNGGSATEAEQASIKAGLMKLRLPAVPAKVAATMTDECQTIPYVFRFNKGTVD